MSTKSKRKAAPAENERESSFAWALAAMKQAEKATPKRPRYWRGSLVQSVDTLEELGRYVAMMLEITSEPGARTAALDDVLWNANEWLFRNHSPLVPKNNGSVPDVRGMLMQLAQRIQSVSPVEPFLDDGVHEPHFLIFKGQRFKIARPQTFKLLRYFWNREKATFADLKIEHDKESVFRSDVSDRAVTSALNRFKTDTMSTGISWILRSKDACVYKERTKPVGEFS